MSAVASTPRSPQRDDGEPPRTRPRLQAPLARGAPSVLSVQSHVVHGYVGNRSAVFPLQLLGFEVDVINSVQFSCHTGYPTLRGQRLGGEDLRALADGLAANGVLKHTHLLTGYIGTASFLREVVRLLDMLPASCSYVCDPVLGDNGRMYTPKELVDVYRDEVLPRVALLTPNQFEAELLTRRTISDIPSAVAACDALHALGPSTVVLTTLDVPEATGEGQWVAMLLSETGRAKWLLQLPHIGGGPFTGTGDLTAAMLLAWTQIHPWEAPAALEKAGAVLQAVIRRTLSLRSACEVDGRTVPPELAIIHCKRIIEEPPVVTRCRLLEPALPAVRGIVFDMDGTLTLPGQIDFRRMRERTGVPEGEDIITYLRQRYKDDLAGLERAMAIVDEEEDRAFELPKLQPGVRACIERLLREGVHLGMVTRNCQRNVLKFLRHTGLPETAFSPVVTRDSPIANKPDAAPLLHCCEAWGVSPASVVMVGDSLDDVRCGLAAGSITVGVLPPPLDMSTVAHGDEGGGAGRPSEESQRQLAETAHFTISSLDALQRFVRR